MVIKTPTEGGPSVAEDDLVVESLVLRELSHPNIIPILGGGTTQAGARCVGNGGMGDLLILRVLAVDRERHVRVLD